MNSIIKRKKELIEEYNQTKKKFIKADTRYRRKKCRMMLECNFEEILGKSRPTVAEKEAYIELKTLNLKQTKELIYNDLKLIEFEIGICDNELEVELK